MRCTSGKLLADIAPCTRVKQFAGQLEAMRAEKRNARKELSFVFKFPHGSRLMNIVMRNQQSWNGCRVSRIAAGCSDGS